MAKWVILLPADPAFHAPQIFRGPSAKDYTDPVFLYPMAQEERYLLEGERGGRRGGTRNTQLFPEPANSPSCRDRCRLPFFAPIIPGKGIGLILKPVVTLSTVDLFHQPLRKRQPSTHADHRTQFLPLPQQHCRQTSGTPLAQPPKHYIPRAARDKGNLLVKQGVQVCRRLAEAWGL